MAPKKADPASKKAEAVQELPPSTLELALPLWSDAAAFQDPSVTGAPPAICLCIAITGRTSHFEQPSLTTPAR